MFSHYLPASSLDADLDPATTPVSVSAHLNYEHLASLTEKYSGSDIRLVCKEAAMSPVRKVFDRLEQMGPEDQVDESIRVEEVQMEDVLEAIKRTRSSCDTKGLARYKQWEKEMGST